MNNQTEYDYAKLLYSKRYLPGQDICSCGAKLFNIQHLSYSKTHGFFFRCINQNYRKIYPIVTKSFFNKFSYPSMQIISEIMKCFIGNEFNAEKTMKFLTEEKQVHISK